MINKINEGLTGSRFIPVDDEEFTVLEMIYRILSKCDELIDGHNILDELTKLLLKNKVSYEDMKKLYGLTALNGNNKPNFDGSWCGLYPPTLSDEGMRAQVEKNQADIEKLRNDILASENVNYIYVDCLKSDDNDGSSEENAVATLNRAINILNENATKCLSRSWVIKIKGYGNEHTYTAGKIQNLPRFSNNLLIQGDLDVMGNPFTVFEKKGNETAGIWIEPARGEGVIIDSIFFKNYNVGFNGYGVLMKNHGYLYVYRCYADNCDIGFAGVNNVTITVQKCKLFNCHAGCRCLYNGCATFGAGTGGSHLSDGGYGNEFYNCYYGVFFSRNSVGHSDYNKFIECTIGCHVEMNSRIATLSCIFDNCNYGVKADGGAEWIGGINKEVDTFINIPTNGVPYDLHGNSRYCRIQSLYCKTYSKFIDCFGSDIQTNILTGSTDETEMFRSSPKIGCLPPYYLDRDGVSIKVIVKGSINGVGTKSIKLSLIGLNDDNTNNRKNIDGSEIKFTQDYDTETYFKCEFEFTFKKDNYIRTVSGQSHSYNGKNTENKESSYVAGAKAKTDGKKQFRVYGQLSDSSATIKINQVQVMITN